MSVRSPTAGPWSSSQWRPDNEFETDRLILSEYLDIYHMERYRHRLSRDGQPLYYFGVAERKPGTIPESMIDAPVAAGASVRAAM